MIESERKTDFPVCIWFRRIFCEKVIQKLGSEITNYDSHEKKFRGFMQETRIQVTCHYSLYRKFKFLEFSTSLMLNKRKNYLFSSSKHSCPKLFLAGYH